MADSELGLSVRLGSLVAAFDPGQQVRLGNLVLAPPGSLVLALLDSLVLDLGPRVRLGSLVPARLGSLVPALLVSWRRQRPSWSRAGDRAPPASSAVRCASVPS